MSLPPGSRLGPYEIVGLLGAGGMGEVYRASDLRLGRTVAIKIILNDLSGAPELRHRFEREARAISSLSHPHICALFDIGDHDGVAYLVLEHLDGETLAARIAARPLSIDQVLRYAVEIASALDAAHRHGIIHRDLKPANVMLTKMGAKLLDFGLAKAEARVGAPLAGPDMATLPTTQRGLTRPDAIVGTFHYMAPEQLQGKGSDARSDLFAFGATVYEMATGRKAFDGTTQAGVIAAILDREPEPMSRHEPLTPPALERVVKRCLTKDPDERWQTARDLLAELTWIHEQVGGSRFMTPVAPAKRPGRRLVLMIGIASAIAVTIVIGGVNYFVNPLRAPLAPAMTPNDGLDRGKPKGPRVGEPVIVEPFENRTGDRSLDAYSPVIADRLIQALTEAGIGGIVAVSNTPNGARSVVKGAYYAHGSTLEINARLTEIGTGKIKYAFEPITGQAAAFEALVAKLQQDVSGAAAFAALRYIGIEQVSHAPTYEAYREFADGMDFFGRDNVTAITHFQRAAALDPEFFWSRMHIVTAYENLGRWDRALETFTPLLKRRHRLSVFERLIMDWWQARVRGQRTEALARVVEAQKLDPSNGMATFLVSSASVSLNRLQPAVDAAQTISHEHFQPTWALATWLFWPELTALHLLGDFESELRQARDHGRLVPQSIPYREAEARALIGRGQIADALRVLDEALSVPDSGGPMILSLARELRAHGYRKESIDLANRGAAWYRNRLLETRSTPPDRLGLARALYLAERWSEAREVLAADQRVLESNIEYTGYLGVLAARRGDRVAADRYAASLRNVKQLHVFGEHTFWRAKIAALLHDPQTAVGLLREALAQGKVFTIDMHRDMDLEPLRDDAAFRALMQPKP